jgi:Predicted phosphohydrolases
MRLQNNWIQISNIEIYSSKLPIGFTGYKIVQLSDLHSKSFGKRQETLISKIKKIKPDLIVITGDLIDISTTDDKNVMDLIYGIKDEAPIYFVTGNHEIANQKFKYFEQNLKDEGVNLLRNKSIKLERNGSFITIAGIDDSGSSNMENSDAYTLKVLSSELEKTININLASNFTILCSHRPEYLSLYAKYNIDLVFTGHAHGGQIRLPFIGGLFAPNQGFFPKYTSGSYKQNECVMVVSRGLGNGSFPLRIFNRPEIVVATLKN